MRVSAFRQLGVCMFAVRLVGCAVVLSLSCASLAAAQASTANADLAEITSYKLTMPVLKQVVAATRNLVAAMKADPRFQQMATLEAERARLEAKEEPTDADLERMEKLDEEMDRLGDGVDNFLGGNKSLDEMEAAARRDPMVSGAMKSAGISAREYAKFFAAYMQAAMISGFKKAGMVKEMPKEANLDNIKFIEEHAAEIEGFMKEFEGFGKKEP